MFISRRATGLTSVSKKAFASQQVKGPVPKLGMGGTSIGDMYTRIPNAQALETVAAAYDNGIRFFDTAPWYGLGLSEARFGLALNDYPRDEYIMQTKVGRTLMPVVEPLSKWSGNLRFQEHYEYTAEAFRAQHWNSLQRMGCGRIDSLVIHDLEPNNFNSSWDEAAAKLENELAGPEGGFREL